MRMRTTHVASCLCPTTQPPTLPASIYTWRDHCPCNYGSSVVCHDESVTLARHLFVSMSRDMLTLPPSLLAWPPSLLALEARVSMLALWVSIMGSHVLAC